MGRPIRKGVKVTNDWSHVSELDVRRFEEKLDRLAEGAFGVDCDGDCPVRIIVVDRQRQDPLHFEPLESTHRLWDAWRRGDRPAAEYQEMLDRNLRTAVMNVSLAAEQLERARRGMEQW